MVTKGEGLIIWSRDFFHSVFDPLCLPIFKTYYVVNGRGCNMNIEARVGEVWSPGLVIAIS